MQAAASKHEQKSRYGAHRCEDCAGVALAVRSTLQQRLQKLSSQQELSDNKAATTRTPCVFASIT